MFLKNFVKYFNTGFHVAAMYCIDSENRFMMHKLNTIKRYG